MEPKQDALARPGAAGNGPVVPQVDAPENAWEAMAQLEREWEGLAWSEDWHHRRRRIVSDWDRIHRRAESLQEELAPKMLSPKALASWKEWKSYRLIPGPEMLKGMDAARRLAPEAADFEDR